MNTNKNTNNQLINQFAYKIHTQYHDSHSEKIDLWYQSSVCHLDMWFEETIDLSGESFLNKLKSDSELHVFESIDIIHTNNFSFSF